MNDNESNNTSQEDQHKKSIILADDLNKESILKVIVEYDEENDYTTVFLTPHNMPGVNPSEIKINNEDFISFDGNELTQQLKDLIVTNGFDEIEAIASEMRDGKYIDSGEDYSDSLHDLAALIADEVSQQIEKDKKRQKTMLDEIEATFSIDNIKSGMSVQQTSAIDDANFTVNVNGDIELDPDTPPEKDPFQEVDKEGQESLTETSASVSLDVAGRSIPLGDLSYFYGISKGGKVGITKKDIRGTELMDDLQRTVSQLIEDGVLSPPKALTETILLNRLVKAINKETAKHFGVEHNKLKNDPEHQRIFRMQVDQGMTKEDAINTVALEKEMKQAEAKQQEKNQEKDLEHDIEKDILKEFDSPSM